MVYLCVGVVDYHNTNTRPCLGGKCGAAAKFGTATEVANELIGSTTNTLARQHKQQQQQQHQQQQHKQQRSRCLTLHNLPNEERDRATQPSSAVVSYNFTMKGKGKKGKAMGKGKKG